MNVNDLSDGCQCACRRDRTERRTSAEPRRELRVEWKRMGSIVDPHSIPLILSQCCRSDRLICFVVIDSINSSLSPFHPLAFSFPFLRSFVRSLFPNFNFAFRFSFGQIFPAHSIQSTRPSTHQHQHTTKYPFNNNNNNTSHTYTTQQ